MIYDIFLKPDAARERLTKGPSKAEVKLLPPLAQ